jgi:ATP-dependent DNA helicase RecG
MMIRESLAHDLPEPDYEQRQGFFVLTLWRNWLTAAVMAAYGLNERQQLGIAFLKTHERITNAEYQQAARASRATASRDLDDLVTKGILKRVGKTGKGTHYVLTRKRLINASNDS